MISLVTVRLLDVPYSADRDYDYRLPVGVPLPDVGRLLLVPFGVANRLSYAVCVATREVEETQRPLKELYALLPPDYRITSEILRLCVFLHEHTLCSVGDAVRAAFPAACLGDLREVYRVNGEAPSAIKTKKDTLLAYLVAHPDTTKKGLEAALGTDAVKGTLASLCKEGRVTRVFLQAPPAAPKTQRFYSLVPTGDERRALLRGDSPLSEKARAVCLFLDAEGSVTEREITDRLNISVSPLKTLVSRGILAQEEREIERNPYLALARKRDTTPVALSRAQKAAYDEIEAVYEKKKPAKPAKKQNDVLAAALADARRQTSSSAARALADLEKMQSKKGVGGGGGDGDGPGGGGIYDVYVAQVILAVQPNWSMPVYSRSNMVVQVRIQLDPHGKVLDCKVEKSSGRPEFDASAVNAVIRTGDLPAPPTPAQQDLLISFNSQQMLGR